MFPIDHRIIIFKRPLRRFFLFGRLFAFGRLFSPSGALFYAQTQPRTVEGGLRPHLFKAGLRPGPYLEQLESAEKLDGGF